MFWLQESLSIGTIQFLSTLIKWTLFCVMFLWLCVSYLIYYMCVWVQQWVMSVTAGLTVSMCPWCRWVVWKGGISAQSCTWLATLKSLSTLSPPGGHGKTRTARLDEALTLSIHLSLSVSDYTEGRDGRREGRWTEKIEKEKKIKKKRESDECERGWREQEGINENEKRRGWGEETGNEEKKKGRLVERKGERRREEGINKEEGWWKYDGGVKGKRQMKKEKDGAKEEEVWRNIGRLITEKEHTHTHTLFSDDFPSFTFILKTFTHIRGCFQKLHDLFIIETHSDWGFKLMLTSTCCCLGLLVVWT